MSLALGVTLVAGYSHRTTPGPDSTCLNVSDGKMCVCLHELHLSCRVTLRQILDPSTVLFEECPQERARLLVIIYYLSPIVAPRIK